ncbi:uncharacterized protein LOC127749871 [Frankliniella occidentalis]|uniref:Uncharacterized protein LOC127749871 n=1 Tax=Frankliniella occidentalis TaxID=133901 RepID=A0A9C6U9T3_FRAOC|nr:uncharacterized protein LOC127749871 [Frankliniella occidentalis]
MDPHSASGLCRGLSPRARAPPNQAVACQGRRGPGRRPDSKRSPPSPAEPCRAAPSPRQPSPRRASARECRIAFSSAMDNIIGLPSHRTARSRRRRPGRDSLFKVVVISPGPFVLQKQKQNG